MVVGKSGYAGSFPVVFTNPTLPQSVLTSTGQDWPVTYLKDYSSDPWAITSDSQGNFYAVDFERSRMLAYEQPFPTLTPTFIASPAPTLTTSPTPTSTNTSTNTLTNTPTNTPSNTSTNTPTSTLTVSDGQTAWSFTGSQSAGVTMTNTLIPTTSFSFCIWVNPSSISGSSLQPIVGGVTTPGGTATDGMFLVANFGAAPQWFWFNDASYTQVRASVGDNTALPLNTWSFLCFT